MNFENDRYRAITELVHEGILELDKNATIIYANSKMAHLLGFAKNEVVGKTFFSLLSDIDRKNAENYWLQCQQGMRAGIDVNFQAKDGSQILSQLHMVPQIDQGEFSGASAVVTEEKQGTRKESHLIVGEDKFTLLIKNSRHPIFILSLEGIIISVSRAFASNLNYKIEDLLGKPFSAFIHHEDTFDLQNLAPDSSFSKNRVIDLEVRLKSYPGLWKWHHVNGIPHLDTGGNICGLECYAAEIEGKKNIERLRLEMSADHELMLNASPAFIFYKDKNNRFIHINNALASAMGIPKSDIEGKTTWDLYPTDAAENYWEDDKKVMESRVPRLNIIEKMETPHGVMWLRTDKIPHIDDRGEVIGIIGFSIDITELKQAEQNLYSLTQRLQIATQSANLGIWDWNIIDNNMIWDDRMLELYGHTRESSPGGILAWESGLHPDDRDRTIEECQAALRGEKDFKTNFRTLNSQGRVRHIKADGIVLRNDKGEPLRMIGVNSDITDQVNMQAQLLQTSKLASIGTLAAGVAHEINNPLAIIKSNLFILGEKLKATDLGSKLGMLIEKQERAVDRIATIVRSLRNFSRSDTDATELIDIHQAITETVNLCEAIYKKSGLTIQTEFASKSPFVKANLGKLEQVIMNFMSNAKDATESNTNEGVITIKTMDDGECVRIKFSDNGIGISKSDIPHILDPFFTTKPPGKGTGLGLSISSSIISGFGGSLSIESEVGLGTCIEVKLPSAKVKIKPRRMPGVI